MFMVTQPRCPWAGSWLIEAQVVCGIMSPFSVAGRGDKTFAMAKMMGWKQAPGTDRKSTTLLLHRAG